MALDNSKIEVWCDLKTEADEDSLWRMAGDFFFNTTIPKGPRIFFSLYPFQHYEPQQFKQKEKSKKKKDEKKPGMEKKKYAHDTCSEIKGMSLLLHLILLF